MQIISLPLLLLCRHNPITDLFLLPKYNS